MNNKDVLNKKRLKLKVIYCIYTLCFASTYTLIYFI